MASSSSAGTAALQVTLAHLAGALTYTELSNVQTNKKLWEEYAHNYSTPSAATAAAQPTTDSTFEGVGASAAPWVLEMASHVSRDAQQLQCLGDEWSDTASLEQSLNHFLWPYLGRDTLSSAEWEQSRAIEQRIAGGEAGLVNPLPPSSLQAWCASAADASPSGPSAAASSSASTVPAPGALVVAELGVGGARVATRVFPHVQQLHCMDIAEGMLQQAQLALGRKYQRMQQQQQQQQQQASSSAAAAAAGPQCAAAAALPVAPAVKLPLPPNVSLSLLPSAPSLPPRFTGTCDFIYCFDVLVHCDLHIISAYFHSLRALLKPPPSAQQRAAGAYVPRIFLHTANLLAPLGWERFRKQSKATAGGFFFLSPEIIHHLAQQHGYRIVQQSQWKPTTHTSDNLYYQRDFLFVLESLAL